jgi:uncharacterized protein
MPLLVHLPQLARQSLNLEGCLPPHELELDRDDELLNWGGELTYRLEIRRVGDAIRLEGSLDVDLACQCARCLRAFRQHLCLKPWALEIPLVGEESVAVRGDVVDLTPFLREDIVLALPQHPLCDPECRGLASMPPRGTGNSDAGSLPDAGVSAWSALDRLKF